MVADPRLKNDDWLLANLLETGEVLGISQVCKIFKRFILISYQDIIGLIMIVEIGI